MNETFTGCLPDNRPTFEKEKDFRHEEIFARGTTKWIEKSEVKRYPLRNQDGSLSCVPQSGALMAGMLNEMEEGYFPILSAAYIYQQRQNQDYGGMMGSDFFELWRNKGMTFEVSMPSQNIGEKEINAVRKKPSDDQIAQVFRIDAYFNLRFDIDDIADAIAMNKPVMMWLMMPQDDFARVEPRVTDKDTNIMHHSIVGVDFTLRNGKKYIVAQESWNLNSTDNGVRYISEEVIKNHMTFCKYPTDLPNNWRDNSDIPKPEKPVVNLTRELEFGMEGEDVKQLQRVLRYEECFPQNVDITGKFLQITRLGVIAFQKKYNIDTVGRVGKITMAFINNLYKL